METPRTLLSKQGIKKTRYNTAPGFSHEETLGWNWQQLVFFFLFPVARRPELGSGQ